MTSPATDTSTPQVRAELVGPELKARDGEEIWTIQVNGQIYLTVSQQGRHGGWVDADLKLGPMSRDELSSSGFSAMVAGELKQGESVPFKLTVNRALDPVSGIAKVVNAVKAQGAFRTNFEIETMSDANVEILESALFDAVLARFK